MTFHTTMLSEVTVIPYKNNSM